MGYNLFGSIGFVKSRVLAINKWDFYNGNTPNVAVRDLTPGVEDTPQPANLHGFAQGTWPSSGPHYFITETDFNGATYSVFSWSDPFGSNSFGKVGTYNLVNATGVSIGFPVNAPQQSGGTLTANDWRPQDAEYRNGFLWTTDTVSCNPGGGTVDCIRWAQINPTNASVVQAGVYASNSQYRIFGDVAANHCNDMAVGYTKTSTNMYPGIFVTGRNSGDPAGTLQSEVQLRAGQLEYKDFLGSPFRWGDYTGMTNDPNGRDFWYLGEYSKNTGDTPANWGTYIGCFRPTSCSPPQSSTPQSPLLQGLDIQAYLPMINNYVLVVPPCGYSIN